MANKPLTAREKPIFDMGASSATRKESLIDLAKYHDVSVQHVEKLAVMITTWIDEREVQNSG